VPIDDTGEHQLKEAAANAFLRMQDAAKADGVNLVPLSAYRSIEDQQYLFFEVKSIRGQDTSTRAEVSAPPGYSEHHTGYAVDIGDGTDPESNLSISFEDTEAFRWLQENASHYSFELSFLPNNEQGIAYEPWHWRYVGDQSSLETFYKGIPQPPPANLTEDSLGNDSLGNDSLTNDSLGENTSTEENLTPPSQ
jgi:D-alanyl-D-alanine carboxypeptidase